MARIGVGYDSHRLAPGRPFILAGQPIPHSLGLAGHSDGDAVAHAVTDALLGAAALGDIGALFPDSDPGWKDADSMGLLGRVVRRVADAGFRVGNVDVTVIAEEPKIGPWRGAMVEALAGVLRIPPGAVGVKAKTNEGMGFIGRREGIAVIAVATLEAA